jgi:N-methylhydantoinase A/oxoprolinase/acetone carboxylase beta subunit
MFGVRNPAHELRVRELVTELSTRPVTCGHELASSLDAPRRALTAALNARMVPVIHELIRAVQEIMREKEILAPLMMVKGNGSLINTETAKRKPVGTVLSGPAASILGGSVLSGGGNAVVADMGGTTTDIAVVTDGQPELSSHGVRIGDWKPMVEAVRVISIGLGGDSEARFGGKSGIEIGPRRVVPLSLLAHQYPHVVDALKIQMDKPPGRGNNRFALQLEHSEVLLSACTRAELHAWEVLRKGPVELDSIVETDRETARAIARLQRMGLVIYSGFTPSDAAHVLGLSTHWNGDAAKLAALIWARQMRQVYGLGRWQQGDAITPSQHVFECVNQRICRALIEVGLHQHRKLERSEAKDFTQFLAELVYESSETPDKALDSGVLFHLKFSADYPVVAVGAPAATFLPDATERLGVKLILPERAEVANAYGAVMGKVIQRAEVTITQPNFGTFIVHSDHEPRQYGSLNNAMQTATAIETMCNTT